MNTPIQDWADEHVVYAPGQVITKDKARASWVMWCSENGVRPGPGTGMGKAIVASGGKARTKPVRWENVTILDPVDAGYRAQSQGEARGEADPMANLEDVVAALAALAPIAADMRALDQAALRLLGLPAAGLCSVCGQVTRHDDLVHVACR